MFEHEHLVKMGVTPDLVIRTGSHMYGTATPDSDEDFRGFVIPTPEYLLGRRTFEQAESKDPDWVVWSLAKFIKLLEIGSPNVYELLFAPKIQYASHAGLALLGSTDLFIAKHAIKPLIGFAESEWKSVERSRGDAGEFRYKSAGHSIRLLEQGWDLLTKKTMIFPRPNAALLLQIKQGLVSFEDCKKLYEDALANLRKIESVSTIPDRADTNKIDKLYYDLIGPKLKAFL